MNSSKNGNKTTHIETSSTSNAIEEICWKEAQRNRTGTGEEFEVEQILCLIENMTPYPNKAVKGGKLIMQDRGAGQLQQPYPWKGMEPV